MCVVTKTSPSWLKESISSFDTNKISTVAGFEKRLFLGPGLTVSPDGKWMLYSQYEQLGTELTLVENFR
jgi:hypothetical protein